jgi:hypothetical protein
MRCIRSEDCIAICDTVSKLNINGSASCGYQPKKGIVIATRCVNGYRINTAPAKSITHSSLRWCVYVTALSVQCTGGNNPVGRVSFSVRGYEVPTEPSESSGTPVCFLRIVWLCLIHPGNDSSTDVFCHPDAHFCFSSADVQTTKIVKNGCNFGGRIHLTGMDSVTAPPQNDLGSYDENFLDYIPEDLIEEPDNSSNCVNSVVAAPVASMRFSAVLPIGMSAIPSSNQPIPYSNRNSSQHDNTNIPNFASFQTRGLVNGNTTVQ